MEKDKERIEELEKKVAYLEGLIPYLQLQAGYKFVTPVYPPVNTSPNIHWHNGSPCYNNPRVYC